MNVRALTFDTVVADIVQVLDALHVHSELRVVGFSFGGLLAQALAQQQPGRIARMVLINSTACTRPGPDDLQILKAELNRCPEVISINGDIDFALAACYRDLSSRFDARTALPSLQVPTLVMSAAQDTYMRHGQARELAHLLPCAEHVEIADAGHFSIITHAEQVNRCLLDFLRPVAGVAARTLQLGSA